jgi:hypothetical protein
MTLANSHFVSNWKAVMHIKTGCLIKKWVCHTHDNKTRHHYYINKLVSIIAQNKPETCHAATTSLATQVFDRMDSNLCSSRTHL